MRWIARLIPICALVCVISCATVKTVYVPEGGPVRLRETVPNAKVWVQDEKGVWVEATFDLPAGWYALSDNIR